MLTISTKLILSNHATTNILKAKVGMSLLGIKGDSIQIIEVSPHK